MSNPFSSLTIDLSDPSPSPPLVTKIFAIEQHIDQIAPICLENSEYAKIIGILNRSKLAITSLGQQMKKIASKQKRLDLANAKRIKVEETRKCKEEEETAKKALEEANRALETQLKKQEEEMKVMRKRLKLQLRRMEDMRGRKAITDGRGLVSHGTRSDKKRKREGMTSEELGILIANAKMEQEGSKSKLLSEKANYDAVVAERGAVEKLFESAENGEKELYQTKLRSLDTLVQTAFEELDAATEMKRMYQHRVIELEFQLNELK